MNACRVTASSGQKRATVVGRRNVSENLAESDERARWRRVLDFPLVSLIIAIAMVLVTIIVSAFVSNRLVPPIAG